METLPPGMPLFGLEKDPVLLKLAIITEPKRGPNHWPRTYVGLVVRSWLVIPLDYVADLDDGLVSMKAIISGFVKIGYEVVAAEIGPNE